MIPRIKTDVGTDKGKCIWSASMVSRTCLSPVGAFALARTPIVQSQLQTEVDALYAERQAAQSSKGGGGGGVEIRCQSAGIPPVVSCQACIVVSGDLAAEGQQCF